MDVRIVPTIAIVCLYIVLTAGFQVLLHTCGGETTVHLFSGAGEDPCGCGDMHEQDRCCTTQVITVHLDDVQQGATVTLPVPDARTSTGRSGLSARGRGVTDRRQFATFFHPFPHPQLHIPHLNRTGEL
jgi:hypothetical protein